MKKVKLKDLKDNSTFRLSIKGTASYRLQTFDEKKRQAIYTSIRSNRTFKSGWNREVFAL